MLYKRYIRSFIFLVFLALLVYNTTPVSACTPAPPTPWFDETLSVVSSNLPGGISLNTLDSGIELENSTGSAIYMTDNGSLKKITDKNLHITVNAAYYLQANETLSIEGDYYKQIPLKTNNIVADNRPENVAIPQPQNVILDMLVGQQAYTLQLKITYQLNNHYRYDSVYMYAHGCSDFYLMQSLLNPFTIMTTVLTGGFIIIIVLVLIARKSRQ